MGVADHSAPTAPLSSVEALGRHAVTCRQHMETHETKTRLGKICHMENTEMAEVTNEGIGNYRHNVRRDTVPGSRGFLA